MLLFHKWNLFLLKTSGDSQTQSGGTDFLQFLSLLQFHTNEVIRIREAQVSREVEHQAFEAVLTNHNRLFCQTIWIRLHWTGVYPLVLKVSRVLQDCTEKINCVTTLQHINLLNHITNLERRRLWPLDKHAGCSVLTVKRHTGRHVFGLHLNRTSGTLKWHHMFWGTALTDDERSTPAHMWRDCNKSEMFHVSDLNYTTFTPFLLQWISEQWARNVWFVCSIRQARIICKGQVGNWGTLWLTASHEMSF